jgi:hypothetical protein
MLNASAAAAGSMKVEGKAKAGSDPGLCRFLNWKGPSVLSIFLADIGRGFHFRGSTDIFLS